MRRNSCAEQIIFEDAQVNHRSPLMHYRYIIIQDTNNQSRGSAIYGSGCGDVLHSSPISIALH